MGKERVLAEMARQGVEVLLLGREGNARYVSGARRLFLAGERAFAPGCVVVRATEQVHVLSNTDFGIPNEIPHANLYPTSWDPATLAARVAAIPGVSDAQRIGVDGLTPLFEALLPAAELVDGEALMRAARRLKTTDEVAHIRAAAEVAEAMVAAALDAAANGAPAAAAKAVAMQTMAAQGVTTAAFEPRVARHGDRVTVAVGVLRDGWEADVTRSTPQVPNTAIDCCHPGTAVADLPGGPHGVGLGYEVLSPDDVLEPGMVLSIGVAIEPAKVPSPDDYGVRDTVLVTRDAPEVLTRARM
ncbi:MAG: aminopeptidase P family N-terminal domain-containing protein [Acidimicrobiia bacterium]|nr:aminopeptidase P family N-terminal domain-containing protein [Acidimicrobiia bacterium]